MYNSYDQSNIFDVLDLNSTDCPNVRKISQMDCEEDIQSYLEMRSEVTKKVEELPSTTDSQRPLEPEERLEEQELMVPESEQIQEDIQNGQNNSNEEILFIQLPYEEQTKKRACLNAKTNQTQNIGKHLRAATSAYLEIYVHHRIFSPGALSAIKDFSKTNGSLKDFSELFEWEELREKCRGYYESKCLVEQLLSSKKMSFQSKIVMIRHLEHFRQLTYGKKGGWKMVIEI